MISSYDDLSSETGAELGCEDPVRCCRILQDMAGHNIPDNVFDSVLRVIIPVIAECADADRAISNLGRWADRVGSRASAYNLLATYPTAAKILITILSTSQYFADLIVSNPELFEILTNPKIRDRSRNREAILADMTRRIDLAKTPGARRDALRRIKPEEFLRIGARDLLGFVSFETTVREISDFADAAIISALSICNQELGLTDPPFAVFALGKLGGLELNYSSDVDLIFVHGDEELNFEPNKLGESIRSTLANVTDAGFVFRVDLRLRPEGRFGPVSRSLSSCRSYYESWAESWERQAHLKVRFVAGDAALGTAFLKMAEEFVFPSKVPSQFVDEIRNNKRRLEQKIAQAGETLTNVKEGFGGIRDIEFAVQLLQLTAGGAHPEIRSPNTLDALRRLKEFGLITTEEQNSLSGSYIFLRVVEHRLQILDERAVRRLPTDVKELRKFARRLGYPSEAEFSKDYTAHTQRTNRLFQELFYGSKSEDREAGKSVQLDGISNLLTDQENPDMRRTLMEEIRKLGFKNPETASDILYRDVAGSQYGGITPEARHNFAEIAGSLLNACSTTNDPDQALRGLDALAEAVPSRAALYRSLVDTPDFLTRLCWAAAEGPALWQTLLSHLEFLDLIANPEEDTPASNLLPGTAESLARFALRSRIWTAFRDLWGLIDVETVMKEVSAAADAIVEAGIQISIAETTYQGTFAVIGMGKLGGNELGYGSDLDVLYVCDAEHVAEAAGLADKLQKILGVELSRFGFQCELDARLRPDGRKGVLALDIASYANYYKNSAATWEKQALIKARAVAGDKQLGREFADMVQDVVYGQPVGSGMEDEIRSMKHRIERERLKSANDLKLASGGMADIEWTAQLLQLRHGNKRKKLRKHGTLPALLALRDDAIITQADWSLLSEAYKKLIQLRNHLFLSRGVGVNSPAELPNDLIEKMAAVRSIVTTLFY
jgi:glutamate-ammonia-ligase adenylyltransferase